MGIIGHLKRTLSRLNELVRNRATDKQLQATIVRKEAIYYKEPDKAQYPEAAAAFLKELSTLLPNAVIFDEALTCSPMLNAYFMPSEPDRFF